VSGGLRQKPALQPMGAVLSKRKKLSRITTGDERGEPAHDKVFHLCCHKTHRH